MSMNDFFIWVGLFLFATMIIAFYRVIKGPSMIDRMVAANVVGTKTTVMLVVIGSIFVGSVDNSSRVEMFVDFALTYAFLNFIGSIAASKYFYKINAVDPEHIDSSGLEEEGMQ